MRSYLGRKGTQRNFPEVNRAKWCLPGCNSAHGVIGIWGCAIVETGHLCGPAFCFLNYERSWLVARDRLFEVVALSARGERCDHDAPYAARVPTLGRDDDGDMAI